jgi:hypothetical protein
MNPKPGKDLQRRFNATTKLLERGRSPFECQFPSFSSTYGPSRLNRGDGDCQPTGLIEQLRMMRRLSIGHLEQDVAMADAARWTEAEQVLPA